MAICHCKMSSGILYLVASFALGILTIVSAVFTILYLANSKKGKFIWLSIFLFSLSLLLLFIFLLVGTITKKARNFVDGIERNFEMNVDSSFAASQYNIADTANSKQIKYLKLLEKEEHENIPPQFYSYLGFADYYRLPLVYPFSIHCSNELLSGSLINEVNVEKFDVSNNGEKQLGIDDISEFNFDQNILVAKRSGNGKMQTSYFIYFFDSGAVEEFDNLNDLKIRAGKLKFTKLHMLLTCKEYYDLLH